MWWSWREQLLAVQLPSRISWMRNFVGHSCIFSKVHVNSWLYFLCYIFYSVFIILVLSWAEPFSILISLGVNAVFAWVEVSSCQTYISFKTKPLHNTARRLWSLEHSQAGEHHGLIHSCIIIEELLTGSVWVLSTHYHRDAQCAFGHATARHPNEASTRKSASFKSTQFKMQT